MPAVACGTKTCSRPSPRPATNAAQSAVRSSTTLAVAGAVAAGLGIHATDRATSALGSRAMDVAPSPGAPTWRCSRSPAARSRTAATTSSCARPTTRPTGGATSCCSRARPAPTRRRAGSTGSRREFPGVPAPRVRRRRRPTGTVDDLAAFADAGLSTEASTVMTATSVHEPPRPEPRGDVPPARRRRRLGASRSSSTLAGEDERPDGFGVRDRARPRPSAPHRGAGTAQWFGAFVDGRLLASMGLVAAEPGAGALPGGQDPPRRPRPRPRRHARAPRQPVRLRRARRHDAGDGRRPRLPRDPDLPLGRLRRHRGPAQAERKPLDGRCRRLLRAVGSARRRRRTRTAPARSAPPPYSSR